MCISGPTLVYQKCSRSFRDPCLDPSPLPNDDRDIPFVLVGDNSFALKTWLMKPYAHM